MHTVGDELLNTTKEIMYLNAVKHDNILSMYGFCFHPTRSCLIYQYMANGSLEDRLQRKVRLTYVILSASMYIYFTINHLNRYMA